jgi:2'-5' RNA ligase
VSNLVIVAIPDENDRVWKVSSEKVPHLTVLFLGDVDQVSNLETVVQFVEHAANTTLNRFYLPVDRRGELGDDPDLGPADVLFFKKGRYDYKAIRDFRAALLQDNNIRTAYDSAPQFDGPWQPHLTLGYEKQPAKPDETDRDYGFYDVCFNKIAVWVDNYDGPEFLLKDFWDEWDALETVPMDVAMSDLPPVDEATAIMERGADFLAHYGVKGMKWGQRKEVDRKTGLHPGETKKEGIQRFLDPEGHKIGTDIAKIAVGYLVPIVAPLAWPANIRMTRAAARGVKSKALDSQEKKFAKNAMSPKNFAAIHNGSLAKANPAVSAINKKYGDPNKNPSTRKKYDAEVLKVMQDAYRESANSLVNKANTMHLDVEFKNDGQDFVIHARQGPGTPMPVRVKHAAADDLENEEITVEITGKIKRDASGYIVGFDFDNFDDLDSKTPAQHALDLGAVLVANLLNGDELEHYGVKGMRWGVRKEAPVTTETHIDTGLRKRRTMVRAEGGESLPAHHDAVKAAVAKRIVKKSGTDALSTQELRDLANRLQVENQVGILMSSKGKQFVAKELESGGKKAIKKGAKGGAKIAAPHVIRRASKGAATVATTAALAL